MKISLIILTLISSSAFAIMAPTGLHKTLRCEAQGKNKFQVYIEQDNHQPKFINIVIVGADRIEKVYPGTRTQSGRVGGSVTYSAPANGGRLGLSINYTSAPIRGGFRAATLVSQVLGRVTTTNLLCSQIMN